MSEDQANKPADPKNAAETPNIVKIAFEYLKPHVVTIVAAVMILGMVSQVDTKVGNAYSLLSQRITALEEKIDLLDKKSDVATRHLDEGIALFQKQVSELGSDIEALNKQVKDIKYDKIYRTN